MEKNIEGDIVKIRKDGRVVIPQSTREELGLEPGDLISIRVEKLRITKEKRTKKKNGTGVVSQAQPAPSNRSENRTAQGGLIAK